MEQLEFSPAFKTISRCRYCIFICHLREWHSSVSTLEAASKCEVHSLVCLYTCKNFLLFTENTLFWSRCFIKPCFSCFSYSSSGQFCLLCCLGPQVKHECKCMWWKTELTEGNRAGMRCAQFTPGSCCILQSVPAACDFPKAHSCYGGYIKVIICTCIFYIPAFFLNVQILWRSTFHYVEEKWGERGFGKNVRVGKKGMHTQPCTYQIFSQRTVGHG